MSVLNNPLSRSLQLSTQMGPSAGFPSFPKADVTGVKEGYLVGSDVAYEAGDG